MKKYLIIFAALLLLLVGCTKVDPTQPSSEQTTQPPVTGIYDPQDPMEKATGGAVRVYRPENGGYRDIAMLGSKPLLIKDGEMLLLQGDVGEVVAQAKTDASVAQVQSVGFDSSAQVVAYYCQETNEVVMLNPNLQQIDRIAMPEDIQGIPAVDLARDTVYYFVPGQLRALNLSTGISRVIRMHDHQTAQIAQVLFDGQWLQCLFDGNVWEYIAVQNGQSVLQNVEYEPFFTYEDRYFLTRYDGRVQQTLTGRRDGETLQITLPEANLVNALVMDSILGYEMGNDLAISLYHADSGLKSAFVKLEGICNLSALYMTESHIWLLAEDQNGAQALYQWDPAKSPAEDTGSYTHPLYTAENPDLDSIAACKDAAAVIEQQYGVNIRIWKDAVSVSEDTVIVPEYQEQTILEMLDEVDQALAVVPDWFLQMTAKYHRVWINLVRDTGVAGVNCVQEWKDGDCYITVSCKEDAGIGVLKGIGYAMDSYVLGNSRDFDNWGQLNPETFQYDAASQYQKVYAQSFLSGEQQYFADADGLRSLSADRASVFCWALHPEGESVFASEPMQLKLKRLCEGIREAYRLEKKKDVVYPWEQYLTLELDYNNLR